MSILSTGSITASQRPSSEKWPPENLVLGSRFTKDGRTVAAIQQDGSLVCLRTVPADPRAYEDAALTTATEAQKMKLFARRQVLGAHVSAADMLAPPRRCSYSESR